MAAVSRRHAGALHCASWKQALQQLLVGAIILLLSPFMMTLAVDVLTLLLATTPPTKQVVENEYNHGRGLVRLAHHLRGLPCPLRCRNAVGGHGGHLHLRSLKCCVLQPLFNGVADELNTQHVRLIKESASLVIMLAASVDDCVPKMDRERL